MSTIHLHRATVTWERGSQPFLDNRYTRAHRWRFDGGAEVLASSSPFVVPLPLSDPAGVDPEEAFVATLSSCHMLFFLSFAAAAGLLVDRYRDEAAGTMGRNAAGREFVAHVVLRPALWLSGSRPPADDEIAHLHHRAHEHCFIAQSVLSEVVVEPGPARFDPA
jgi:organic hydroperoxide reductase OsmC/OhrA